MLNQKLMLVDSAARVPLATQLRHGTAHQYPSSFTGFRSITAAARIAERVQHVINHKTHTAAIPAMVVIAMTLRKLPRSIDP